VLVDNSPISMPKLLIVEPDKALLSTVASALHSKNYGIVGTAIESAAAIDYFGRVRADVLITEVDLDNGPMGTTGIDLALHLRSVFPMLGVVFLSSITDLSLVSAPPRLLGSSYFLPKSKITKLSMIELAIKESIRLVRSPETASHDIYKINSRSKNKQGLTKADVQLLAYLSIGLSNKEIARRKNIALKSCENSIARLAKKVDVPHLSETNQRVMLVREYFKIMGKLSS